MTFSKVEYYGGSKHTELTAGTPFYTILYGDYTRVLNFTEDAPLATVTVNLPLVTKVRGLGFMYYFIVNDTSAVMSVKDFSAITLKTLAAGECVAVGLKDKANTSGDWVFQVGQMGTRRVTSRVRSWG